MISTTEQKEANILINEKDMNNFKQNRRGLGENRDHLKDIHVRLY